MRQSSPVRCCVYIRVSTQNQIKQFDSSLDNQEKQTGEFINRLSERDGRKWEVIDLLREPAQSGSNEDRPLYKKMLRGIESGKYDAIITYEMSRLFRSIKDHVIFLDLIRRKSVALHAVHDETDFESADGKMKMGLKAVLNEYESDRVSDRVTRRIHSSAREGKWCGGSLLYGFKRNLERRSHMEIDEQSAEVVRLIFSKYLELGSYKLVADHVNSLGLIRKGRKKAKALNDDDGSFIPDRQWTVNTIRGALANRAYVGMREINKKGRRPAHGEPPPGYEVVKAVWPAIVDEAIFEAVQRKITANAKQRHNTSATRVHTYYLRDLVHCPYCDVMLENGGSKKKADRYYHYYRHHSGVQKENCPLASGLDAKRLEALVLRRIDSLASNGEILKEIVARAKQSSGDVLPDLERELRTRRGDLDKWAAKIQRLTDRLASMEGNVGLDLIAEQLPTIKLERDGINQRIAELEQRIEEERAFALDEKDIAIALRDAKVTLDALVPGERQELMTCLIKRVSVFADRVEIAFYWGKRWIAQITKEFAFIRRMGRPKNNAPQDKFLRSVSWLPGRDSNPRPDD